MGDITDDEAVKLAKELLDIAEPGYEDVIKIAHKVIELVERQRWITASEKPERDGIYQVELPGGKVTYSYYITMHSLGWSLSDVIRWKPFSLPQPPEIREK